jgi:nicotinamide mononucleotide transporter
MNLVEIAANGFNAASIFLAGRNSVHMWWTTIVNCALFMYVFYEARLYADVTLQVFFVTTAVVGWWRWLHGTQGAELPVRHSAPALVMWSLVAGVVVTVGYGWLLYTFTDAYAPFLDSLVLAFSVVGQLLLIDRRVETWWCWLLVNTIAVPLYASRGLYVTAVLYAAFWLNAIVALRRWRKLAVSGGRWSAASSQ